MGMLEVAAYEKICSFVRNYAFQHRISYCRGKLWSGVPLYDFWRVRGRWLGHRAQERMPRNDERAPSLPARLHLEISLSGLWADSQGLDVGPNASVCPFGAVNRRPP
jgi:hypothetical protein